MVNTRESQRFILDNCSQQAPFVFVPDGLDGDVYLKAQKDIKKGDELCWNYNLKGDSSQGVGRGQVEDMARFFTGHHI